MGSRPGLCTEVAFFLRLSTLVEECGRGINSEIIAVGWIVAAGKGSATLLGSVVHGWPKGYLVTGRLTTSSQPTKSVNGTRSFVWPTIPVTTFRFRFGCGYGDNVPVWVRLRRQRSEVGRAHRKLQVGSAAGTTRCVGDIRAAHREEGRVEQKVKSSEMCPRTNHSPSRENISKSINTRRTTIEPRVSREFKTTSNLSKSEYEQLRKNTALEKRTQTKK